MKLRSVEATPRYLKALAEIRQSAPRADDFHAGLEWTLSRHPEWGNAAPRSGCSIYPVQVGPQRVAAYYVFDDVKVTLLALRAVPADPDYYGG